MTVQQGDAFAYIFPSDVKIVKPKLVEITEESIKGYGRIVKDFHNPVDSRVEIVPWPKPNGRPLDPGTGMGGGVTSGSFTLYKNFTSETCEGENKAVDGRYTTGTLIHPIKGTSKTTRVFTREANYHPDGGQLFFPKPNNPFILLLALPSDDIKPENFVAFYGDGTVGVCINPGVWHQPPFPVEEKATFDGKQGAVHGCVSCDFFEEFNTIIRVPLMSPEDYEQMKFYKRTP